MTMLASSNAERLAIFKKLAKSFLDEDPDPSAILLEMLKLRTSDLLGEPIKLFSFENVRYVQQLVPNFYRFFPNLQLLESECRRYHFPTSAFHLFLLSALRSILRAPISLASTLYALRSSLFAQSYLPGK